jgi:nucleotide-binding universal stress UspA family protein
VVHAAPEVTVAWVDPSLGAVPADQIVHDALERATRAVPGLTVLQRVVVGRPTRVLLEQAGTAELLVVGSRGLGAFTGLLIGSVSEQVAEHAGCPVVVVRGESSNPGLPVLVGVDGSTANQPAVEFAFAVADRRRLGLVAIGAAPPGWIAPPIGYPTMPVPDPAEQLREVREALEMAVRPWADKYPQVDLRLWPVIGRPATELIHASEYGSLLVIGSRGHGGLAGLLLGSVSRHALHHAECPLAVVRS